jgi:hypothetical protein
MNPEPNSDLSPDLNEGLDAQISAISALRNQVYVLLIALIVVSGTLTVYLYREASVAGKELNATNTLLANVNESQAMIVTFANQLAAYAQTHPDIRPLLTKYGIPLTGLPAQPAAPKK